MVSEFKINFHARTSLSLIPPRELPILDLLILFLAHLHRVIILFIYK